MSRFNILFFITLGFLSVACKPSRNKSVEDIRRIETTLYSPQATSFSEEKADSLISLYDGFIKAFSDDSLSPLFLFKSANLAMNSGDGKGAISRFDQFIQAYPGNQKAALCMFFKGYIYENLMKDLEKAKEAYLLFMEKYPDHELVKDARMSIQNLGKTPEQIVREFEAIRKYDSVRKADSIANLSRLKGRKPKS
jgi:outer membrane protein assembly factor BamD (BamD/ComL family)